MRTEMCYDQNGNVYPIDQIDGTEIWNVPESMRFIKFGDLAETEREVLDALRRDSLPHPRNGEGLSEGTLFAECRISRPNTRIPMEILVGVIVESDGERYVEGNDLVSYHSNNDPSVRPDLIGFELDRPPERRRLFVGDRLFGTILTPERYSTIVDTLRGISKERSIAHPATKEFNRQSDEYRSVVNQYEEVGLQEVYSGMFKSGGTQKSDGWTLVAVHPFYMEYHGSNGQRKKLSPEQKSALMESYDDLFRSHEGPLVVVEEQDKIPETLDRLRKNGVLGDIYFVPTENKLSVLFPFTEDTEFMDLLRRLGTEGLKFVGGHDSGNTPYVSHDPLSRRTFNYSGCLRGLANRIEKKGFQKVETITKYVYS